MKKKPTTNDIFILMENNKFIEAHKTLVSLMECDQKIIYLFTCLDKLLPLYKLKKPKNKQVEAALCATQVYLEDYLGDNICVREPQIFAAYAASAGEEAFTTDDFMNSYAHAVKHLLYAIECAWTYAAYNNVDKYLNWCVEEFCNCINLSTTVTETTHRKLIKEGLNLIKPI